MSPSQPHPFCKWNTSVDDIAEAYWDKDESLADKTVDMGKNEIRFAVMHQSTIIQAALRIMKVAKNTKDICEQSPDYEATRSSKLFICVQDLPQYHGSFSISINNLASKKQSPSLLPVYTLKKLECHGALVSSL